MSKELALVKKDIVDVVENKIKEYQESGEIHFPTNYSPENAMKSAWLTLQNTVDRNKKPALSVCTKDSIANSLLDMVVQGLSPAKKQCYFIVYGDKLELQRSYFGTMAVTKRLKDVKDIRSQVIYEDDVFEMTIEFGVKKIVKHEQKLQNIDMNKIVGAYTIIEKTDGSSYIEVMNINQIKQAWRQSKMNVVDENGNIKAGSVHDKFTDQMVLKTVINRACKQFANTSDDSDLLIETFNRTTENEYQDNKAALDPKQEVKENANKEILDFDEPVVDVEVTEIQEPKPQEEIPKEKVQEGPGF